MYTLKDVCSLLNLTEHTVRYYCDEGLVPSLERDKNNRRLFNEESIEWLRGIKYLRDLGMSIDAIKKYELLCQEDGLSAIEKRYDMILEQVKLAHEELLNAKQRLDFLEKKANHEKLILEQVIKDDKNPNKKHNV